MPASARPGGCADERADGHHGGHRPRGFQAAFGIAADPRTNTVYLADGAGKMWVIGGRTDTGTGTGPGGRGTPRGAPDPPGKANYTPHHRHNTRPPPISPP